VRRTPEVMVKVTGGGAKVGAVSAHLNYISRQGRLEIESDEGERITSRDEHKALLKDWHLQHARGNLYRKFGTPENRGGAVPGNRATFRPASYTRAKINSSEFQPGQRRRRLKALAEASINSVEGPDASGSMLPTFTRVPSAAATVRLIRCADPLLTVLSGWSATA
jgi:hypothetical protein